MRKTGLFRSRLGLHRSGLDEPYPSMKNRLENPTRRKDQKRFTLCAARIILIYIMGISGPGPETKPCPKSAEHPDAVSASLASRSARISHRHDKARPIRHLTRFILIPSSRGRSSLAASETLSMLGKTAGTGGWMTQKGIESSRAMNAVDLSRDRLIVATQYRQSRACPDHEIGYF